MSQTVSQLVPSGELGSGQQHCGGRVKETGGSCQEPPRVMLGVLGEKWTEVGEIRLGM